MKITHFSGILIVTWEAWRLLTFQGSWSLRGRHEAKIFTFPGIRIRKLLLSLATVCKDSRETEYFKPSKHSSPRLFRFFSRFPPSIPQEIPLLVYLDPLDCIDRRIVKVSWCLVFTSIVLCLTFQYGCSDLGFFEWYNLKWDSFAGPCLDWSTFHETLKKNNDLSFTPSPPLPFLSY